MSRNLELNKLFDLPEHKDDGKKKTDKEEREERKRAKLQFEREVYAAANQRGISRNMITIGQKKSISEIIAAAEKKVQAAEKKRKTQTNKNTKQVKLEQIKQAARNLGLDPSTIKTVPKVFNMNKIVATLKKKVTKTTGKAAKNAEKNQIKQAVLARGIAEANYKYIPKKTVNQLVAYAQQRTAKATLKQTQNAKLQQVKEAAVARGIDPSTIKRVQGTVEAAIRALNTKKAKLTGAQTRAQLMAQMKQAVINADINQKYYKFVPKKTAQSHVRYARQRRNASLQKIRKGTVKARMLANSGFSETEIKAAFCSRAK